MGCIGLFPCAAPCDIEFLRNLSARLEKSAVRVFLPFCILAYIPRPAACVAAVFRPRDNISAPCSSLRIKVVLPFLTAVRFGYSDFQAALLALSEKQAASFLCIRSQLGYVPASFGYVTHRYHSFPRLYFSAY